MGMFAKMMEGFARWSERRYWGRSMMSSRNSVRSLRKKKILAYLFHGIIFQINRSPVSRCLAYRWLACLSFCSPLLARLVPSLAPRKLKVRGKRCSASFPCFA
uniref:Uncharacterized protein n=1 Tax=Parascaris equorum TaxID=6256 RepID=A0A914RQC9_PAREQ